MFQIIKVYFIFNLHFKKKKNKLAIVCGGLIVRRVFRPFGDDYFFERNLRR